MILNSDHTCQLVFVCAAHGYLVGSSVLLLRETGIAEQMMNN